MKDNIKIFAIVENQHAALVLRNFILNDKEKSNKIIYLNIFSPEGVNLDFFKKIDFKRYAFKRSFKKLIHIFLELLKSKSDVLVLNDLGLLSKIIILVFPAKKVVVIDDGVASIYRSNLDINLLNFRKRTHYYSMWAQVSKLQKGLFNQKFFKTSKSTTVANKFFYIASIKDESSISRQSEKNIIDKLKEKSKELNQDLIILIHRNNIVEDYTNDVYFHGIEIIKLSEPFELYYLSNVFKNCSFSTWYSSALNIVFSEHKRFIVTSNYIDPEYNLKKTLIQKIFTIKRPATVVYDYYLKKGAHDLGVEIEPDLKKR